MYIEIDTKALTRLAVYNMHAKSPKRPFCVGSESPVLLPGTPVRVVLLLLSTVVSRKEGGYEGVLLGGFSPDTSEGGRLDVEGGS